MTADPANTTDVELMQRIGTGESDAVAELYDRYSGVLMGLALRIVRERTEAEDVLHDAFLAVGDRARSYTAERGTVAAWLITMVRNLSIDRRRRLDRRGAIARDLVAHEPAWQGEPADPESQLLGASEAARVRRALASLPPPQRMTLELTFFAGLSYPEIAAQERLPLGTIKSRAARALTALRDALAKDLCG